MSPAIDPRAAPRRRKHLTPSDPAPSAAPRLGAVEVGLLAALGLLWGSAYIVIREGEVFGASPLAYAAVRYALSAAAFAVLAGARREPWPSRHSLLVASSVGGVLLIGLYGGFLYWGEQFTTGGYAAALSSTAPILTVVASYALLPQERLGRLALVGLGIGFLGVLVLVLPDLLQGGVGSVAGVLAVLAAFVSTTFGSVLLRRYGGGRQTLWQIGAQFGVGAAILGVGMLVVPGPEVLPPTPAVWGALLLLVVFSSVLGYFVYFLLHHRVGPNRANIVAYLLPLVGIGFGTGLFGEPVTVPEVVGFLVVLGGVTLVLRDTARSS